MSSKRWFKVGGTVTVSAYVFVEAETEGEAIQKAKAAGVGLAGIGRSGANPVEVAVVEDFDGTFVPDEREVDEEDPDEEWLIDAGLLDDDSDDDSDDSDDRNL